MQQLVSEESRIWIYQSNRELTQEEVQLIKAKGDAFVQQWKAHQKDLSAEFDVLYNLFIVLAVDENMIPASGCSIDESVAFIKSIESEFKIDLLDKLNLAYRSGNGNIQVDHMNEFMGKIKSGEINEETIVFNNLINTKKDLQLCWEVPAKESWHKQLLN
ncbi:MAG: ABC transporter ATPase [Crocinitomicaceae bacterium]|nr:ABC transporter ATPase [Crocinitomicaceae bacterium]